MSQSSKIKELIQQIVGAEKILPIPGVVKEVREDVCDVSINDEFLVTDVKLKTTMGATDNQLVIRPNVGSHVLMMSLSGELNNLTIVKIDDIHTLSYKQEDLQIEIDEEGKLLVSKGEVSLSSLFEELVEIIKALQVSTPMGPSGTPLPTTITKVDEFQANYETLLKVND